MCPAVSVAASKVLWPSAARRESPTGEQRSVANPSSSIVMAKSSCGPHLPTTGWDAMRHVLVFELAGQRLGLSASALREVIRAVAIAALPKAPPIVEGV